MPFGMAEASASDGEIDHEPPDGATAGQAQHRRARATIVLLAALLVATAGMYASIVPVTSAITPDESSHIAYGYSLLDADLPTVYDAQSGGPYTYPTHRTIFTANHPPLFYVMTGPAIAGLNVVTDPLSAVRLTRWLSIAFAAVAIVATAGVFRECLPNQPLTWVLGTAFVALVPELGLVASHLYNDSLALALGTAALMFGLRVHRRGPDRRSIVLLSLTSTAAALTRASALPIALLAVAIAAVGVLRAAERGRRIRDLVRLFATTGLPLALIAGPFYLRNQWLYGDPTASEALFELLGRESRTGDWLLDFENWRLVFAATLTTVRGDSYMTSTVTLFVRDAVLPITVLIAGAASYVAFRLATKKMPPGRRRRYLEISLLALACSLITVFGFARHVLGGGLPHARYLFSLYWVVGLTLALTLRALGRWITVALVAMLVVIANVHAFVRLDRIVSRAWAEPGDRNVIDRWQTAISSLGYLSTMLFVACSAGLVLASFLVVRNVHRMTSPNQLAA